LIVAGAGLEPATVPFITRPLYLLSYPAAVIRKFRTTEPFSPNGEDGGPYRGNSRNGLDK